MLAEAKKLGKRLVSVALQLLVDPTSSMANIAGKTQYMASGPS